MLWKRNWIGYHPHDDDDDDSNNVVTPPVAD